MCGGLARSGRSSSSIGRFGIRWRLTLQIRSSKITNREMEYAAIFVLLSGRSEEGGVHFRASEP
jgi:hypothetical protein